MKDYKNRKALIRYIFSGIVFGTIGIFRRFIPLDSGLIAMLRGALGAVFLLLFLALNGNPFHISHIGKKRFLLLLLTGADIGFNWVALFEAYNYTTVPVATLCYYMQPIFLIIAAPFVFKEKITAKKAACVFAAFCGMILVSGITEGGWNGDVRGILLGLLSGVMYASTMIMNKLITGVNRYEKTAVELAGAAIAVFPYVLLRGVFSDPATAAGVTPLTVVLILFIGIFSTGYIYAVYFGSVEKLKVQQMAVFGYVDPVVAIILSGMILNEHVGIAGAVGAALIIGAAIVSELSDGKE